MGAVLKTKIVKLGNSQGVRIPKVVLEQAGLSGPVEIEVQRDQLILRGAAQPARAGWSDAFRRMAARGDDALVDAADLAPSTWDAEEWEW